VKSLRFAFRCARRYSRALGITIASMLLLVGVQLYAPQLVRSMVTTVTDPAAGPDTVNTIARLALEYELPLWNFWRAAQNAVNHGLEPDLEHLNTLTGPPATDFSVPISIEYGKEVKNLTGLQLLEFLMHELAAPALKATPAP
jgi:hypothetical protein